MRGDGEPPMRSRASEAALWRRSCLTEAAENDAERYLDLAGFVDGRLDPDERERVAAWLAVDATAAGDVAAAHAVARTAEDPPAAPDSIIARAVLLVGRREPQRGEVIPFPARQPDRPRLHRMAGWGSLAAAMAVASWLGFTLGVDTSLSFTQAVRGGEDGILSDLLDPSVGFVRDLTGGRAT